MKIICFSLPHKSYMKSTRSEYCYRQYKKARKKNLPNWKDLHKKFKTQRNYVTKISRQNRRDNLIADLKKQSATNNLTGMWKTIKHATNMESKFASNSHHNADLDPKVVNDFFTNVGPYIQADIPPSKHYSIDHYLGPQVSGTR